MHLELLLTNEPRSLPSVQAFVHTTLLQLSLEAQTATKLEQLVLAAVQHAIASAYPAGEEGSIQLTVTERLGKLEIRVRDFGLPQDVEVLERQLHAPDSPASRLFAAELIAAVDELHWLAFGSQGKALQLIKWLHTASIAETSPAAALAPVSADAPLAPPQQYAIRRMRPLEAVQVSQLMYRTYGNTYFNEDVYYPERIAAQNQHNVLISVVAVAADGKLAGHCALERNQSGPVAELGQAAVDPAHRSRGLLDQMKEALEEQARALQLAGWFADAVAVHTFTQQSNAHHGGHVCGIDLAVSPKTEAFRNIAAALTQRVSCVVYFHWLGQPAPRTVFVSPRHREIVAAIYQNLQCPVTFGTPHPAGDAHGTLTIKFDQRAALAMIRAEHLAADSVATIRHSVRQLVERSRAEAVLVELPLSEPAAAEVCGALESAGLGFAGVGPHFSPAGDVLKLAYVVEPLAREPIKTFEPFAGRLTDYALAEQERVRAQL
jgi:anti-sigma regulatory factor (Ser/Thr protein kinase)